MLKKPINVNDRDLHKKPTSPINHSVSILLYISGPVYVLFANAQNATNIICVKIYLQKVLQNASPWIAFEYRTSSSLAPKTSRSIYIHKD